MKSSSGVSLKQSWGSSACWEQHWISLSALENSENSLPLQFGALSTGNSLLFLSVCFSCFPKLSQPVGWAGPFAQCPDPGWGFAVVLPAPAGTERGASTACFPPAGQELLQVSCSQGSLGWAPAFPELVPGGLLKSLHKAGGRCRISWCICLPRAQQAVAAHG